jgi:hypothetical protein
LSYAWTSRLIRGSHCRGEDSGGDTSDEDSHKAAEAIEKFTAALSALQTTVDKQKLEEILGEPILPRIRLDVQSNLFTACYLGSPCTSSVAVAGQKISRFWVCTAPPPILPALRSSTSDFLFEVGPVGLAPTETHIVVGAPRSYLTPRTTTLAAQSSASLCRGYTPLRIFAICRADRRLILQMVSWCESPCLISDDAILL